MDTTNHRLVKTNSHSGDNQGLRIAMHEVFYKDGKPWCFTQDPVFVQGFSWDHDIANTGDVPVDDLIVKDLLETLDRLYKALTLPILDGRSGGDFPDYDS